MDSGDAAPGSPRVLPPCAPGVGSGACTAVDTSIDTTNPNEPAHISDSECLMCGSAGMGMDWICISQSWQVAGVFSCSP